MRSDPSSRLRISRARVLTMSAQRIFLCAAFSLIAWPAAGIAYPIPLNGQWRFELDTADVGVRQQFFNRTLRDVIRLPGILQAQGLGDEISTNTPWVLSLYDRYWFLREDYKAYIEPGKVKVPFLSQPPRHYLG